MGRGYPCFQATGRLPEKQGQCACCHMPATDWVRVANDYMRGNDSSFFVCSRHASMAENSFRRFRAHLRTADQYRRNRAALVEQADG